jgi:hypothetical protein
MPLIVLLLAVLLTQSGEAHKGATSKYTYNADVYPVFLNRCGGCHIDGGVGPMSLLTYEEAFPWAEALRAELFAAGVDTSKDFVKAAHRDISARELDVVLEWAGGGTPEGDRALTPATPIFTNDWADGSPDVTVPLPEHRMPAEEMQDAREAVVSIPISASHAVRAIDVRPGDPAIVREVILTHRTPRRPDRQLATWVPRQTRIPLAVVPPVHVQAGSQLVARIRYKKTWKHEGQPMTDQSTVGLYFVP